MLSAAFGNKAGLLTVQATLACCRRSIVAPFLLAGMSNLFHLKLLKSKGTIAAVCFISGPCRTLPCLSWRVSDGFDFGILIKCSDAALTADATGLISPIRHVRAVGCSAIDADEACPQPADEG